MDQDSTVLAESVPEGKWSHFLCLLSTLFFPFEGKILACRKKTRAEKVIGHSIQLPPTNQNDIWVDSSLCYIERARPVHREPGKEWAMWV